MRIGFSELDVREDIAVPDHELRIFRRQELIDVSQPAAGFEQHGFMDEPDFGVLPAARRKGLRPSLWAVVRVDEETARAGGVELRERALNHRLTAQGEKWLWTMLRQRT